MLIRFSASWCAPCKVQKPQWDVLAARARSQGVVVYEVDFDARPDLAQQYGVDSVPTYVYVGPKGTIYRREHPAHVELHRFQD